MSIFSWFDTSDLPQSSIKKQLIDQGGHFVAGVLLYGLYLFGAFAVATSHNFWLLIPLFSGIYALLSVTSTKFTKIGLAKLLMSAAIFAAVAISAIPVSISMSLIPLAGFLGGFVIGVGREIYQHASIKLSKSALIDALFFGIGSLVLTLIVF